MNHRFRQVCGLVGVLALTGGSASAQPDLGDGAKKPASSPAPRPASGPASGPIDPYAPAGEGPAADSPAEEAAPIDPYGDPGPASPSSPAPPAPIDPYADAPAPAAPVKSAKQKAIDDAVAKALFERGRTLFTSGDYANAKQLFIESLERSPDGPSADPALQFLRSSNERMGIANLDDGVPGTQPAGEGDASEPLDPYGDDGERVAEAPPVNPFADEALAGEGGRDDLGPDDRERARRSLMLWGGGYGFVAGMALAGPYDDADEFRGGAVLTGLLGAGAGVAGAYYAARDREITPGQANAVASAGLWTALAGGFLADVVTGVDETSANQVYGGLALGGLVGTGVGILYARKVNPEEGDVAFTNSLASYGGVGGLMLGVAMDPPTGEAYSLNAALGIAAGIGTGLYLADRVEVSRSRMLRVDLGALAGLAVPWVTLYPAIADDNSSSDEQATGFVSTLTMGAGAYLAWRLTRDMDEPANGPLTDPPVAGLINRSADGTWGAGVPALRPATMPALDPQTRGMALDLVGGRF